MADLFEGAVGAVDDRLRLLASRRKTSPRGLFVPAGRHEILEGDLSMGVTSAVDVDDDMRSVHG